MIADLKPYPATRDSGVPWLRELPAAWTVARNGSLFAQRNERGSSDLPLLEVSLKTGVRVRTLDSSGRKQMMSDREKYKRARKGDLAYNMMRMWQGAIGVVPVEGLVSPAYVVARPLPGIEPRFFEHLFRTDAYMGEVDKFSHGIVKDRNRLYWEEFKQMPSPVPPPVEQTAIVRFLGHADRRIRRYIRAKQQLIQVLEEQKRAIIHRAVTRGLDPNVRLKPSGVDWLGDVPEHWEVVPLRRRWQITDCKHVTVPFVDDGVPLASVREAQSFELNLDAANRTIPEWYEKLIEGGRKPRPGDLIYCRNVSVGAAALVTTEDPFAMGQDVCLIRSSSENQRWLNYFLHSKAMSDQLTSILVGSTFSRINVADIKALLIPVPARPEQDRIAGFLDAGLRQLDAGIGICHKEQALLREFRTRLIADVVTGKLDVREAAARLPQEDAEEPEAFDTDDVPEGGSENAEGDGSDLEADGEAS